MGAPEISKIFNVSVTPIYKILLEFGIKIRDEELARRQHSLDESYFEIIDTKEKAYVLGILYTDGNNCTKSHRIALGMNDLDVVEFVKNQLKSTHKIQTIFKDRENGHNSVHYRLDIISQKLSADLDKLGCVPRKSRKLKFPDDKMVNKNLVKYFILGCIDGDGWVFYYKARQYFIFGFVGTRNMCVSIKKFLEKTLNVHVNLNKVKASDFLYTISSSSQKTVYKILKFLYNDVPFKMKRKFDTFLNLEAKIEN